MRERNTTRAPLIPALAIAATLWAIYLVTAGDPVLGVDPAHTILQSAALAVSAILAVLLAGSLILSIAPSITGEAPTGFQRVVVYGLLTFGASFATLRYLGLDLGAVLTTSAIVTAAVGFAMQPTLSSMIAGLALHADRIVHVGDGILLDGEFVEIVSMNWRAAVGRRPDGRTIVVPNGKLTDAATEVLRAGEAHRAEFQFLAPIDYPPQTICDLVREAVADLPLVDQTMQVRVAPLGFEPDKESTRLRVQYWTRAFADRSLMEGESVRRIWYLFQRNRIPFPHPTACSLSAGAQIESGIALLAKEDPASHIEKWLAAQRPTFANAPQLAQTLAKSARLLLFAADERIVLPEWSAGWRYLLIRGDARIVPEFDLSPEIDGLHADLDVQRLGPTAAITYLADELSRLIGPYAKAAVMRAGDRAQSYAQLCREVATEIDDPAKRALFLSQVLRGAGPVQTHGTLLAVRRNASGHLTAEPSLRASGEVALLALPPEVFPHSDVMTRSA